MRIERRGDPAPDRAADRSITMPRAAYRAGDALFGVVDRLIPVRDGSRATRRVDLVRSGRDRGVPIAVV
jgi:hypothetical protein